MKRISLFLLPLLYALCLHAQWVPTNGPKRPIETFEVLDFDNFLVGITYCAPQFSSDFGEHWSEVQYAGAYASNVRHFDLRGTPYLWNGYHFWKLYTSPGIVHYGMLRDFPFRASAIAADSSGIYAASLNDGLMMSPTDSNFGIYTNGLPADSTFYPGDTVISRYLFSIALNANSVFVGTEHGVYRASKGAFVFSAANNGLPPLNVYGLYCKDSLLIANVDSNLYRSTDAGNSWSMASTPMQGFCYKLDAVGDTLYASYYQGGLYFSTNDGNNWAEVNPILHNERVYSFARMGNDLYIGTESGLFSNPWQLSPIEYDRCGIVVQSMAKTDSCIAAATRYEVYITQDLGDHWQKVPNPIGFGPSPMMVSMNQRLLWGADSQFLSNTSLFTSEDCGSVWDTVGFPNYNELTFLSSDGQSAIANFNFATYNVYLSGPSLTQTMIQRPTLIDCQTDPVMIVVGNAIYATSCDNVGLLRSYDLGLTWTNVSAGLPNGRVCYMERLGGRLFATYADDIYQAVVGDSVWAPANLGLPSNSGAFFDLEWDGQQYYVCNGRKVWASVDGTHWVDVSYGLPLHSPGGYPYSGMVLKDNVLFVGTWGQGVWKRPISEISVAAAPPVTPATLHLYPNPATDRIYWTSPEKVVQVQCFNTLGQAVDAPSAGDYLDVSRLPHGVYIVRATLRNGSVVSGRVLVEK